MSAARRATIPSSSARPLRILNQRQAKPDKGANKFKDLEV